MYSCLCFVHLFSSRWLTFEWKTMVPKLQRFKLFKMPYIKMPSALMRTFVTPSKFKWGRKQKEEQKKSKTEQTVKKDKGSKVIHC